MNFTQHPTNTRVLGAPVGWKQDELPCHALPVTVVQEGHRTMLVSFWRPTAAERQAIAEGALLQLWIHSADHPPVSLSVEGVEEQG